jgi:flavoprotein
MANQPNCPKEITVANQPNCPSCNETRFSAPPTPIVGAPGVRLVACDACGTVVGVVPEEIHRRLKDIEAKVNHILERMM